MWGRKWYGGWKGVERGTGKGGQVGNRRWRTSGESVGGIRERTVRVI